VYATVWVCVYGCELERGCRVSNK